jgi:probable HAF family extracellular repeat protein
VAVGFSDLSNNQQRAFIWSSGTAMRNLGLLHASDGYSTANGVNSSGQVVGASGDFAFLWQSGSGMQDLGNLGGVGTIAYGINNLGDVVGSSNTSDGSTHAFFWTASSGMQDIGNLGIGSIAYAINDSEQVAGMYTLSDGKTVHAFEWTQLGGMIDLGTLGGPSSGAFAISASGQIAGSTSNVSLQTEGFVWNPIRGMRSLNFAGTTPLGISSAGQVVGYVSLGSNQSGFLWTRATGVQNLSGLISPKGTLVSVAYGINRSGQIAASGRAGHALVLTPVK